MNKYRIINNIILIIAYFTMFIDHVGKIILNNNVFLQVIGRVSFPLFCFGISRGIIKTKSIVNYGYRVLFIAFISQPAYYVLFNNFKLNICFNFALCIYFFRLFQLLRKNESKLIVKFILILGIVSILSVLLLDIVEYGILSLLLIFNCMYFIKNMFNNPMNIALFYGLNVLIAFICHFIYVWSIYDYFYLLYMPIVTLLYNDNGYDKIKKNYLKEVKYSLYPLHLYILMILEFI